MRIGYLATDEKLLTTANSQSKISLSFNKTRAQIYDCKLLPFTDLSNEYVASCVASDENFIELLNTPSLQSTVHIGELMDTNKPFLIKSIFPQSSIPFVKVLTVPKRYSDYPMAEHILGYTNTSGNGITGIEKAFNERLNAHSQSSVISYETDGLRRPLKGVEPTINYAPILTEGVVLTLDSRLQSVCEEIGVKYLKKGAIVMMEPKTGKIKACASFPRYNINSLQDAMQDTKNAPLINRAFYSYNVGSTFKIVTAAAALSQGISENTTFTCTGETDVFGQKFGCHEKGGHGTLDLKRALEVSCNPYFIQLGLTLDKENFRNMALDMSYSKQTYFAEGFMAQKGYLPNLKELANPADIANLAFGQGLLMATPIQVAQMLCCILNDGGTPTASLIEGYTKSGKLIDEHEKLMPPIKCMKKSVAKTIKNYLVSCVMEYPGQLAKPQYTTAGGKTGTAQTGQYKQIKSKKEEILQGWFAGFFPADNPQYAVVILSEDAKSGNQDASPIFAKIADKLNEPIYYSNTN